MRYFWPLPVLLLSILLHAGNSAAQSGSRLVARRIYSQNRLQDSTLYYYSDPAATNPERSQSWAFSGRTGVVAAISELRSVYNSAGSVDTETQFSVEIGSGMLSAVWRRSSGYTPNGDLAATYTDTYSGGQFHPESEEHFSYSGSGRMAEHAVFSVITGPRMNERRTRYAYDSHDFLLTQLNDIGNGGVSWTLSDSTAYLYPRADSAFPVAQSWMYNPDSLKMLPAYTSIVTGANAAGQKTSVYAESYDGDGSPRYTYLDSFGYDAGGRLILNMLRSGVAIVGSYENVLMRTWDYDAASGMLVREQVFGYAAGSWVLNTETRYEYERPGDLGGVPRQPGDAIAWTISPVPAGEVLQVQLRIPGALHYELELRDAQGLSCYRSKGHSIANASVAIPVSALPVGIYLLRLRTENGETRSAKVLIRH